MILDFILSSRVIHILAIIIVSLLLQHVSGRIITKFIERGVRPHARELKRDHKKRLDTLNTVFTTTAGLAIWLVASFAILNVLKVNLASVAAGAGFLGIIIGLGAQATIRDYLAGISILAENQYRVGDIITLSGGTTGDGASGVVEEITLRITKLRDLDGTLNIVRNSDASVITNRTYKYSSVVIDVGVAYDSDIDAVERVMNAVGDELLNDPIFGVDIVEQIKFLRVNEFGESAILVKAVGKVQPARQWEIGGEYRRRLLKAFTAEDIVIAFPQLDLHQIKS